MTALAGAASVFAAPASAATYTTTVSPNPFSYSASQRLVYRLQVTTGATSERLWVSAGPGPAFPGGGYFMEFLEMTLEGSGTVVNSWRSNVISDRFCQPVFPDTHGNYSYSTSRIEVDLPANSMSAIVLPARHYMNAPWRGMDLAVDFRIGPDPARAQVVRSASPTNSGPHGLPISVRTDPPGGPGACLPFGVAAVPRSAFAGKEVLVSGVTDPAVAGQLMTIRAARLGESGPRDLANVAIGGDGAFSYRWTPGGLGDYALGASYRSQATGLTDDFSQASALRVVAPPRRVRPAAITASSRVRCRRRRCVIVVSGAVKRPPSARNASCTGNLRIRVAAGTRRLLSAPTAARSSCRYRAKRRFTLRSPRTKRVTIRVSYLGDPVFEPTQGPAVRVRVGR